MKRKKKRYSYLDMSDFKTSTFFSLHTCFPYVLGNHLTIFKNVCFVYPGLTYLYLLWKKLARTLTGSPKKNLSMGDIPKWTWGH